MKKLGTWLMVAAFLAASVADVAGYRGRALAAWAAILLSRDAVLAVRRALRAHRRSREHRAIEAGAAQAPLREGACVLEGEVAYAVGADRAMRVDFDQVGTEAESSGSWSHTWTEVRRKLTVQPFYLVRADGTRLRVEPMPDESRLFDELESKVLVSQLPAHPSSPARTRFATLVPGERVWITGNLERGLDPESVSAGASAGGSYRQAAWRTSWIFRGRPLIVSSVSLGSHFAERARYHAAHAVVLLVLLAAPLAMRGRYMDRVNGVTVSVPIESVSTETSSDDDRRVIGYTAHATYQGVALESGMLRDVPASGAMMEFRVGARSGNAGAIARLTRDEMFLCFVIAVGAALLSGLFSYLLVRALPWYRSDRVKVTETHPGRLVRPESRAP